MSDIDVTPQPAEVVQAEEGEYALQPIPTTVCGPVEVRELPAIRAGYKTEVAVGTAVGVKLLPFEPRRKSAVIMADTQAIWISSTQAGAQSGASSAVKVVSGVAFPIDHMDEVWAVSATSTTDISVMSVFWSE